MDRTALITLFLFAFLTFGACLFMLSAPLPYVSQSKYDQTGSLREACVRIESDKDLNCDDIDNIKYDRIKWVK